MLNQILIKIANIVYYIYKRVSGQLKKDRKNYRLR